MTPTTQPPSSASSSSPAPTPLIVGIDLGTTHSLIAHCDRAGPRVLGPSLPSVVRLNPDTAKPDAIGHEAARHSVEFPQSTLHSVKRLMGRSLEDLRDDLPHLPYRVVEGPQQTARVQVGDHIKSPQEISALILAQLKGQAQRELGTDVHKAVVTVPAYFDDAQRQATRDAGRLAGLEVVRIVNEPTAAALAYGLTDQTSQTLAVYDLGGGTFDISILRLEQAGDTSVDQVLATAGDTHLGGDDVDHMIVQLIQREIREQFGSDLDFPPATQQAFRHFAQAAKIKLSADTSAAIEVDLGDGRLYQRILTRDELEQMIEPWIARTLDGCKQALRSAKLSPSDIDRVVMVGGSTRIPAVRAAAKAFFGLEPYTALDPDQVVALGAAVQASILSGARQDKLLLDVIPLSLGIETMGQAVAKLITANTTLPAQATERFSTYVDGQTHVKIHVLQGERETVEHCRSLGTFDLADIPPMPAGLPKLEVRFLVDANGILSVTATEARSGRRAAIQIVPNHGLTQDEIQRIEAESFAHAREDMATHRLIDLRLNAKLDIRNIRKSLEKVGDELDDDYRNQIQEHIARVEALIDDASPDLDAFEQAMHRMDHATLRLAEINIARTLREDGLTPGQTSASGASDV